MCKYVSLFVCLSILMASVCTRACVCGGVARATNSASCVRLGYRVGSCFSLLLYKIGRDAQAACLNEDMKEGRNYLQNDGEDCPPTTPHPTPCSDLIV